jgi:hypothetical protein
MPTPSSPSTAITVNATGPVVIDMRGFTLQGQTRYHFPASDYFPTGILIQSSNVTVINGTILGFWNGVVAPATYPITYLTGIDLESILFDSSDNDGSSFNYVNNSVVRNCQYVYNYAGISDWYSQTGNIYINDKVMHSSNPQWAFQVVPAFGYQVGYTYTAIPSIPK